MLPLLHGRKGCQARADQNGIAGTHISTRPARCRADEYPAADGWEHYLQVLESASPVIRAIGVIIVDEFFIRPTETT